MLIVFAAGAGAGCGNESDERPELPVRTLPTVSEVSTELDGLSFDAFIDQSFGHILRRAPETAASLGIYEIYISDGTWLNDLSAEFVDETHTLLTMVRSRLTSYDREALAPDEQLTYDIYDWYLEERIADHAFRDHDYLATQMLNSPHINLFLFFRDFHPLDDFDDAEAYVARLWQVERKLGQVRDGLERQRAAGIVVPRHLISNIVGVIRSIASATPRESPFYTSLTGRLAAAAATPSQRVTLFAEAERAVRLAVLPAYSALADTVSSLDRDAPTSVGVGALPDGLAYYAHELRHHTTTEMTAAEVHQLGLEQVDRIRAEMNALFDELGVQSSLTLARKFERLGEIDGFIAASRVVSTYESIIRDAEARVSEAFDISPSASVRVIGGSSGGFYVAPSFDGSRPGAFYAFSQAPQARFAMPTLAYHEAVPGHHFQIGIAQDLDLPDLRKIIRFTAYVEGWALYAERLASELGWYDGDAAGDLGRLQAEAFRAARLVVDTGIHALGWSRAEAINYMVSATGFSRDAATGQIDRYIAWPGQATAYMVGQLRILELRTRARTALGDDFNLVHWHRLVLTTSDAPLAVLERRVDAWIAAGGGSP